MEKGNAIRSTRALKPPVNGLLNLRSPGFLLLFLEQEWNCPFRSAQLTASITVSGLGQQVDCCVYACYTAETWLLQLVQKYPCSAVDRLKIWPLVPSPFDVLQFVLSLFLAAHQIKASIFCKDLASAPKANEPHCFWSGDIWVSVFHVVPVFFQVTRERRRWHFWSTAEDPCWFDSVPRSIR